jgi:hypothetical protein
LFRVQTYSNFSVDVNEHLLEHVVRDDVGDFVVSGPDVLQEDLLAVLARADGLSLKVNVDSSGNGVGDDKRRAGQVVGTDMRVNTTLKVSVTRQNTSDNQIA